MVGELVLVLRENTERSADVEVLGTAHAVIVREAEYLLYDPDLYRRMASAVSP